MAIAAADDDPDISESLALLSALPLITAVAIRGPDPYGGTRIIVRKVDQQQEGRMQYRYSWEARVGATGHPWDWAGGLTYESAAAAYQAAVQAVQVAERRPRDEATGDAS